MRVTSLWNPAERGWWPTSGCTLLGLLPTDWGLGGPLSSHIGPTRMSKTTLRLKDSGLYRFPFANFYANTNWMTTVTKAADLVRWFQLLCFDGEWGQRPAEGLALWDLLRADPSCADHANASSA